MEINPDILRRYHEGKASEAECRAVENWLNDHSEEPNVLSSNELHSMTDSVWRNIQQQNSEAHVVQLTNTRKRSFALQLTAALAVFLLIGLVCKQWMESDRRHAEAIVITSGKGNIEIFEDHCKLQFSGYLQVFNRSSKVKSIECTNGEKYSLAPGETYYLETIDGKHSIVPESHLSPEDNCARFIRGDVKIDARKIKDNV